MIFIKTGVMILQKTDDLKENDMDRFIPLNKRSKKEQKAFNDKQRRGWNGVKPYTCTFSDVRTYKRNKQKKETKLSLADMD